MLAELSIDVFQYMAYYLNPQDIFSLCQVCREINRMLSNEESQKYRFYHELIFIHFHFTYSIHPMDKLENYKNRTKNDFKTYMVLNGVKYKIRAVKGKRKSRYLPHWTGSKFRYVDVGTVYESNAYCYRTYTDGFKLSYGTADDTVGDGEDRDIEFQVYDSTWDNIWVIAIFGSTIAFDDNNNNNLYKSVIEKPLQVIPFNLKKSENDAGNDGNDDDDTLRVRLQDLLGYHVQTDMEFYDHAKDALPSIYNYRRYISDIGFKPNPTDDNKNKQKEKMIFDGINSLITNRYLKFANRVIQLFPVKLIKIPAI